MVATAKTMTSGARAVRPFLLYGGRANTLLDVMMRGTFSVGANFTSIMKVMAVLRSVGTPRKNFVNLAEKISANWSHDPTFPCAYCRHCLRLQ